MGVTKGSAIPTYKSLCGNNIHNSLLRKYIFKIVYQVKKEKYYNSSSEEADAGTFQVQGQFRLYFEFKISLGYIQPDLSFHKTKQKGDNSVGKVFANMRTIVWKPSTNGKYPV